MTDFVMVAFEADVNIRAGGKMKVPRDIWEDRLDGDAWGEATEQYIRERIDFTHLDGGFDDEEIEIFDVTPT